ncbi:MAG: hypothetical protein ACETWG_04445 [Candidatus Neomarinimicrobiota bacterium]
MPATMPFDKSKKRIIQAYLKGQQEDKTLRYDKLEVKGKVQQEPIYTLNNNELAFNKANGRIHAEVIEKEAELGRSLNIWDQDDQKIIKDLLLSIRKDENEKIKEDLAKKGQIRPGIITCDGIVINGNRRKALLEELYAETGEERYKYLEVHVLPSEITKSELWLIEAGIQMSAPQQLDYSPINNLLKLKEGIDSGLKIVDMAARIYGVTSEKMSSDLERLNLIDEYLSDFIRKPGRYYLVKGVAEHFIDLQNIISWAQRPRGPIRRDWTPDENDINEFKLVGFYYIRGGFSHWRIRDLRDIFAKKEPWEIIKYALDLDSNLTDKELCEEGLGRSSDTGETDDEDYYESLDEGGIQTAIEARDLHEEAVWKAARKNELKTLFEDAKEKEKIIKDTERPIVLAKRALNNINGIPLEPDKLDDPEIDTILQQIITAINELRKITRRFRA